MTDDRTIAKMIGILKEYTSMLDGLAIKMREAPIRLDGQVVDAMVESKINNSNRKQYSEQAKEFAIQELWVDRQFFDRMRPALMETARSVSQWIMHGRVTEASKLELELRLAHLEAAIDRVDQSFHNAINAIKR